MIGIVIPGCYLSWRSMSFLRNLNTLDSLRNPNFRKYFVSRLFDASAMNVRQMALIYLMYRLTDSAAMLGILVLARAIPLLLLTPVAGAFADRTQKKYLIIGANILDMVLAASIGFGIVSGYISADNPGSWWVLIAASIIDGAITGTKGPSNDAMVVEIVGRERITNAIALTQLGMNTFRLISPAIAGILIDVSGFETVYFSMAGLYACAALFMCFVPPLSEPTGARINIAGDIAEVWRYLRKQKDLLYILLTVFLMVFLSMPYTQLMPIFVDDVLGIGGTGYGILVAVQGGGSILGSLILASMPSRIGRGRLLIFAGGLLGVAVSLFAFSESYPVSLVLMAFIGLAQAGRMTLPVALLQSYSESQYRARVMSFYGVEFGLSSFGSFFAAMLVDSIGIQWSVGGMALGLVAAAILIMAFMPRLRRLV